MSSHANCVFESLSLEKDFMLLFCGQRYGIVVKRVLHVQHAYFLSINQLKKKQFFAREISQNIFVHSNEHKKRSVLFRYLTAVFMNRDCREKKKKKVSILIFN